MKKAIKIILYMVLIVAFAGVRVSIRKDLPAEWTYTAVAAGLVSLGLLYWLESGWSWGFIGAARQIKKGDAQAVLDQFTRRRESGDQSLSTKMALASAYTALGRGVEAEQIAHEIWADVEKQGDFASKDQQARIRADLATLALTDAIAAQGRFSEAAQGNLRRIPDAKDANLMAAAAVLYFFMAKQYPEAGQILNQYFPQIRRQKYDLKLSKKYQFIVLYMAYRLFGTDTRRELLKRQDQLKEWETEANQGSNSPYIVRLREIINDVRASLELPSKVIRPIG